MTVGEGLIRVIITVVAVAVVAVVAAVGMVVWGAASALINML